MQVIKGAKNPQAMLSQMMQNNPNYKQVMSYIQQNGGDPKTAFYKMAEEKGIDPNTILSQLQ